MSCYEARPFNPKPRPIATLSDRSPAYTRATPRLRQSDVDARRAWAASDVRKHRSETNVPQ